MPTFAEIQTRVGNYLIDLSTETAALIPEWIQLAIDRAMERHNFRCMEASETYVTTAGVRDLGDIPSDYKEAREKPYLSDGAGGGTGRKTGELEWAAGESEMVRRFNDDSTLDRGPPQFILDPSNDTEFWVYPYPDASSLWGDGNYRIIIPYWAKLTPLASDAATNWFTLNADWYLTFFAIAEGMMFNREEQRAAPYVTKAEQAFRSVRSVDKRSKLTGAALTLGAFRDGNATKGQPRSFGGWGGFRRW